MKLTVVPAVATELWIAKSNAKKLREAGYNVTITFNAFTELFYVLVEIEVAKIPEELLELQCKLVTHGG